MICDSRRVRTDRGGGFGMGQVWLVATSDTASANSFAQCESIRILVFGQERVSAYEWSRIYKHDRIHRI